MIAKDGYKLIVITGILLLLFLAASYLTGLLPIYILTGIIGFIFIFNFFFLRDPERTTPEGDNFVISPADGTVIKIAEVEEPEYFKEKVRLISVFMSVFNVHVNRIPIGGKIEYLDYKKGQYLAAFADKATEINERSIIGIKGEKGKVLFKQIAGILARRIVYHLNKNDEVKAGNRFGLIRYGSRLDVYLPLSAKINVQLKQKVKSGSTILAEFAE
jgi:phosphatidylserine decarboxylase